jgi:hypothetical protein
VIVECNKEFPGAHFTDYGDPAGSNRFSRREGGFTSNTDLVQEECGLTIIPAEQNFNTRINVVDQALARRNGLLIDPRCVRLIGGFQGGYHYPEIMGLPGVYKKEPQKNKYSHVHDAVQYLLSRLYVSSSAQVREEDLYPEEQYLEIF